MEEDGEGGMGGWGDGRGSLARCRCVQTASVPLRLRVVDPMRVRSYWYAGGGFRRCQETRCSILRLSCVILSPPPVIVRCRPAPIKGGVTCSVVTVSLVSRGEKKKRHHHHHHQLCISFHSGQMQETGSIPLVGQTLPNGCWTRLSPRCCCKGNTESLRLRPSASWKQHFY